MKRSFLDFLGRPKIFFGLQLILIAVVLIFISCTPHTPNDPPHTVRIPLLTKIKTTDPADANDQYSGQVSSHTYEGLYEYHYLKRPYVLLPLLAEAMPKTSKDGKVLTLKIKQGVLFQDDPCFVSTNGKGRELTAHDFIYSWKRVVDPKSQFANDWLLSGRIVGLNEWKEAQKKLVKTDFDLPIEGLKAIDRYTLQIQLVQRSFQFEYFLAMPGMAVVPREAVEKYGKDFARNPVGTGPYLYDRQNSNFSSKMIWNRNPNYRKMAYPSEGEPTDKEAGFLEYAGKPLPLNDRVVATVEIESQPRWLGFMAGNYDMAGIPKDNFGESTTGTQDISPELKARGIQLRLDYALDLTRYDFNMQGSIYGKNKYLRQALSLAIDFKPYIELFYSNRAVSAQSPIPPGISGYDPSFKNPFKAHDLARAKELMKKAGYPDGKGLPPLESTVLSDSTNRQTNEYIQKSFEEIGVKMVTKTVTWPEQAAAIKNRKTQFHTMGWMADYPDSENFLQIYYSKNASPGPNESNYSNPEYDRLYEKIVTLEDTPERTKIFKKMVDILVEDAPSIWGVHRIYYYLSQPWLKNFKPNPFVHARVKYWAVDPALRRSR